MLLYIAFLLWLWVKLQSPLLKQMNSPQSRNVILPPSGFKNEMQRDVWRWMMTFVLCVNYLTYVARVPLGFWPCGLCAIILHWNRGIFLNAPVQFTKMVMFDFLPIFVFLGPWWQKVLHWVKGNNGKGSFISAVWKWNGSHLDVAVWLSWEFSTVPAKAVALREMEQAWRCCSG